MKTWTNPNVEELDVKLTALLQWTDDSEWPNGELDGNVIFGGGEGSEGGSEGGTEGGGTEGGNQGGNNEGSTEGGFGTAS